MDRVTTVTGDHRREATHATTKMEAPAAKVESAVASREEAAKLRQRLLKMIVENERLRRANPSNT